MKRTGATELIEQLRRQGVLEVVGIPGGNILPFYDALVNSPLRHILARHEQGAAFIAQGMARASGNPAVCIATSGPGATNLLTGLADAWRDSIPIIAITGQVPRKFIGSQAFQEIDIISMAKHCTKATYAITHANEIATIIPKAFAQASQGRPGPVLIDIPRDVFLEEVSLDVIAPCMNIFPISAKPWEHHLGKACALIAEAKRPLLYIGGGIIHGNAAESLRAFSTSLNIPVLSTLMGLGAMPSDDPLFLGMLGMHGHPVANMALAECDLLIVAGARFDDRATGRLDSFAPSARVIHIDNDEGEFHRMRRADCVLHGCADSVLATLQEQLPISDTKHQQWIARLEILRMEYPMPLQSAHQWIQALASTIGDDCLVTTDVGQHQMWTAQSFPFSRPRQWLTSGGLGTMGFGLPAAIGAALACPTQPVLCISGDGSLSMNLQELATLAECGASVKICMFDNAGLGMVRQQQRLFFGERYSACDYTQQIDWCSIANGFGIPAISVTKPSDLGWRKLLCELGPAFIRIAMPCEELVWPHVPAGKSNSEMLMGCNG